MKNGVDLTTLVKALQQSWKPETSTWGPELPLDNPARGQCVVSSLIVQDFFGGDLVRVHAQGEGIDENHYFNRLVDGTIVDTTGQQYLHPVILSPNPVDLTVGGFSTIRERCLEDEDTQRRYRVLKAYVAHNLQAMI